MVPTNKMTLILGLLRNCHYKLIWNLWVNNNVCNLQQQLHGQANSQESKSLPACVCIILPTTLSNLPTATLATSSETQGQIVGARENLNRRKNMAQKKRKFLIRPVPNSPRHSGF